MSSRKRKGRKPDEPPPPQPLPTLPDEAWYEQTPPGRIERAIQTAREQYNQQLDDLAKKYPPDAERIRATGMTEKEIAELDEELRQEAIAGMEHQARLEVLDEFERIVQEYAERAAQLSRLDDEPARHGPRSWAAEWSEELRCAQIAAEELPDVPAVRWALAEYLHEAEQSLRRAGHHAEIAGSSGDTELSPRAFVARLDGLIARSRQPPADAAPVAVPPQTPTALAEFITRTQGHLETGVPMYQIKRAVDRKEITAESGGDGSLVERGSLLAYTRAWRERQRLKGIPESGKNGNGSIRDNGVIDYRCNDQKCGHVQHHPGPCDECEGPVTFLRRGKKRK